MAQPFVTQADIRLYALLFVTLSSRVYVTAQRSELNTRYVTPSCSRPCSCERLRKSPRDYSKPEDAGLAPSLQQSEVTVYNLLGSALQETEHKYLISMFDELNEYQDVTYYSLKCSLVDTAYTHHGEWGHPKVIQLRDMVTCPGAAPLKEMLFSWEELHINSQYNCTMNPIVEVYEGYKTRGKRSPYFQIFTDALETWKPHSTDYMTNVCLVRGEPADSEKYFLKTCSFCYQCSGEPAVPKQEDVLMEPVRARKPANTSVTFVTQTNSTYRHCPIINFKIYYTLSHNGSLAFTQQFGHIHIDNLLPGYAYDFMLHPVVSCYGGRFTTAPLFYQAATHDSDSEQGAGEARYAEYIIPDFKTFDFSRLVSVLFSLLVFVSLMSPCFWLLTAFG